MNANYKSISLAISLFLAFSATVSAAPGDLDPTFGNGGIVITRGNSFSHLDYALAMAIQSDGKIVVVGDGATGNNWDFAVVRYNTDGSLDNSFGGGIVVTPVSNFHDQATSVAIQADGKIVVAGSGGPNLAVVRYNTNGSLDTSFNGTGLVITSASSGAWDLAIQADGKIIVADGNALIRYNTNGSLDTSFNGTGIVITQSSGVASSVEIQSDGKIVAAGRSQNSLAVVRYNADGSLDTSFNGAGIVVTPVGSSSSASDLAIQSDGKILVVGESRIVTDDSRTADFAVVRYNPNGSLDTSFGGTGKVIISIGNSYEFVSSVAIQPNGKIVVAGTIRNTNGLSSNFAVMRLNSNGALDTTFNGTGNVTTAFCCQEFTSAVAIQSDGKIVVAGATDDILYDFYDFVVVRYQGDDPTPAACPNPIDCADFFVRQHYLDFLGREPDPAGFAGWQLVLNNCVPGDTSCDRIHVSSAFFQSPEFQQRGYFVYRFYPVAFGRKPDYDEFTPDLAKVSGFLTNAELEAAKTAFIAEFITRPAFIAKFNGLSNTEFVDTLLSSADITHPSHDAWIAALTNGSRTRAQVLRDIADSTEVYNKYYNQAFVVMQYFGYLRRQPDALYLNWLAHIDAAGDYRSMINGFMNSMEYRARFGP